MKVADHDLPSVIESLDLRLDVSGDWLWVVQIDCDCGFAATPDWEDEWEPEPLGDALARAQDLQAKGWITRIVPAP